MCVPTTLFLAELSSSSESGKTVSLLSRPPHATACPLGAYAQPITQVVGKDSACSLLVEYAS